ncbi:hypothetical protein DFH27DRAFT_637238 [Peziza echinospora]|nr:hypothetical protein DFH27DRAFT_637238 [Peziza echinospora]
MPPSNHRLHPMSSPSVPTFHNPPRQPTATPAMSRKRKRHTKQTSRPATPPPPQPPRRNTRQTTNALRRALREEGFYADKRAMQAARVSPSPSLSPAAVAHTSTRPAAHGRTLVAHHAAHRLRNESPATHATPATPRRARLPAGSRVDEVPDSQEVEDAGAVEAGMPEWEHATPARAPSPPPPAPQPYSTRFVNRGQHVPIPLPATSTSASPTPPLLEITRKLARARVLLAELSALQQRTSTPDKVDAEIDGDIHPPEPLPPLPSPHDISKHRVHRHPPSTFACAVGYNVCWEQEIVRWQGMAGVSVWDVKRWGGGGCGWGGVYLAVQRGVLEREVRVRFEGGVVG